MSQEDKERIESLECMLIRTIATLHDRHYIEIANCPASWMLCKNKRCQQALALIGEERARALIAEMDEG